MSACEMALARLELIEGLGSLVTLDQLGPLAEAITRFSRDSGGCALSRKRTYRVVALPHPQGATHRGIQSSPACYFTCVLIFGAGERDVTQLE